MRQIRRFGTFLLLVATLACSRDPERAMPVAAVPTGPSGTDARIAFTAGIPGPMDVVFPSRSDAFEFRNALELKYQTGLGRTATSTYVDREGEVVWTQEYIRYRSNGCDHATALQRVMTQIDGGAAGGICAEPSSLFAVEFPSRADVLEFRRALEVKYQLMGRGLSQSFVDIEGSVIWIQEYLRYRVNSCDHVTAAQKVFSQIDGGPVPATCFVPCSYALNPERLDIDHRARTGILEIRPNPVPCEWKAASDASWLTFPSDPSQFGGGRGYALMPYSIAANSGAARTGKIVITYPTGSQTFTVNQDRNPFVAGILLSDPAQSINNVRECQFRGAPTTCTMRASANLPGNTYTYGWSVSYDFNGSVRGGTVTTNSPTFSIAETCGGPGASIEGTESVLNVTLTISDELGNSITITTGAHGQPALYVKNYSC